jgi:hypothetical protein
MFKERAVDIRVAAALDNEILFWTMATAINIFGNLGRGDSPVVRGVTAGCDAYQPRQMIDGPGDFALNQTIFHVDRDVETFRFPVFPLGYAHFI